MASIPMNQDIHYASVNTNIPEEDRQDDKPSVVNPPKWPRGPITLSEGKGWVAITIVKDCLLVVFALLFIVLAIVAHRLHDESVSSYGDKVQAATKLGPTIFPILFAAIAGRTVRVLAQRLVQRGETIGVLEQLLNSQSLAGTVTWLIELQYIHLFGVAMIVMWALSPLGGQSALRLLSVEHSPVLSSSEVSYLAVGKQYSNWLGEGEEPARAAMSAYYSAALLGAERNQNEPADIWGNPKIPLLDSLTVGSDGWHTASPNNPTRYSSLVGVRVQGICRDCNVTFSVETTYSNLSCQNVTHQIPSNKVVEYMGRGFQGWTPGNGTHPFLGFTEQVNQNIWVSSFIGTEHTTKTPLEPDDVSVSFFARGIYGENDPDIFNLDVSVYNCSLTAIRLEAKILCTEGACAVASVRPSEYDKRPSNWTIFHEYPKAFVDLFKFFPWATGYLPYHQASATDNFIYGDISPFNYSFPRNWKTVPDSQVSQRLTMALNSLRQVSVSPWSVSNGYTFGPLRCESGQLTGASIVDDCRHMNITTAAIARDSRVYKASKLWVILLIVCSSAMFILGVSSLVLQSVTTTPDVLGYVSSLTRDNPHVKIPRGATALDGPERTRALRDLKVQMTDIRPDSEIGYFALRSVGDETPRSRLAKKDEARLFE